MPYKLSSGYVQLNTKVNRKKYEHRIVWENKYGPIPDGFDIHHKNGIKDDNQIENLEIIPKSVHTKNHHTINLDLDFLIKNISGGKTLKKLSKELNICRNTIYAHLNGQKVRTLIKA